MNETSDRAKALDMAFKASRLLDEKYYGDIAKALNTDDKNLFVTTCKTAQIEPELAERLWEMLRHRPELKGIIPGGW